MKVVVQRVFQASVEVNGSTIAAIGPGLVVFVGVKHDDDEEDARYLAEKIVHLRIFSDSAGKSNLSALDTQGEILVVSQFTLLADTRKGHRPSFTDAAPAGIAKVLYEYLLKLLRKSSLRIEEGMFQENMLVKIQNSGPVTIILDSKDHGYKNKG